MIKSLNQIPSTKVVGTSPSQVIIRDVGKDVDTLVKTWQVVMKSYLWGVPLIVGCIQCLTNTQNIRPDS